MLHLIILRYVRPLTEIDARRDEHIVFLRQRYAEGRFVMSGPLDPRTGGIILARADTPEQAREWIADDPFNRHGLATYEILGWKPTFRAADVSPALAPGAVTP